MASMAAVVLHTLPDTLIGVVGETVGAAAEGAMEPQFPVELT